jgi:hypothetical protein
MAEKRVKFEELEKAQQDAIVKVVEANGGKLNKKGELTQVSEDVADYAEDIDVIIKSITTGVNAKAEPIFIIGLKDGHASKFLNPETGQYETQFQVHMNGSRANIFTDIRIANGEKIIKELDKSQIKEILRCYRGATATIEVSTTKDADGIYSNVSEVILNRNADLKEDVLDMLKQYSTDEEGI